MNYDLTPLNDVMTSAIERLNALSNICDHCSVRDTSDCCNAPIIYTDICSNCGEHCSSACEECEYKHLKQ